MTSQVLRLVPFDGLWAMKIDIPYSLLAGRGEEAWTCGQVAMDKDAKVAAPGDLAAQCRIVSGYIENILGRAEMPYTNIRRLVLYYVHQSDDDLAKMSRIFRRSLGADCLIDAVPVPGFYYDGVVLEVDVFCGPDISKRVSLELPGGQAQIVQTPDGAWISLRTHSDSVDVALQAVRSVLGDYGLRFQNTMNEHWVAPSDDLAGLVAQRVGLGRDADVRAILDGGPDLTTLQMRAFILKGAAVSTRFSEAGDVRIITRHRGDQAWLQGRALGLHEGLVDQTKAIMAAMETELSHIGATFSDVVKQTVHYVGGTAEELHANMGVRNGYYSEPGPASTGIPVFGFVSDATKTVIDLTVRKGWRD